MTEFNANGLAVGAPWRPASWLSAVGDQPLGVQGVVNSLPPGFLMLENALNRAACNTLVAECEGLERIPHSTAPANASSSEVSAIRTSETVDIFKLSIDVVAVVRHVFTAYVAPHFRADLEWFDRPEVLRYGPGGEYKPHADAENFFPDSQRWQRVIDRDLSILLYLNDSFEGGEIAFPNFGLQFKPKAGLLVAFPSDARYLHAALPVTQGIRYALVSWAAERGTARVGSAKDTYSF
jgi:predicted 2-oxoglutarate/Fe(II)-dependent dioxygenase YbiX